MKQNRFLSQTLSTHMAMPIPPPMQRDATPFWPPVLWSACNKVTSTLQPDIPMGWPREMAPPLTFTCGQNVWTLIGCVNLLDDCWHKCTSQCSSFFIAALRHWISWQQRNFSRWHTIHYITLSTFRPSSLTTARDWAANASLISNKSTWSSCQPAFSTYRRR